VDLHKLSIGGIKTYDWEGSITPSAIGKEPVSEVMLTIDGFVGDTVAATEFHGGPERAVCLYPLEHYALWEKEFGVKLTAPSFGENLSVNGMKEDSVFVGDTFELGEAVIQISQGRIPCSKISKFNQTAGLLKRVVETGYTGYFFRVLKEGKVESSSKLTLVSRNEHHISILFANQIYFHDRKNKEAIGRILKVEELAKEWRNRLEGMLKI
jgi:MOSC domain-containing protein YiiM